MKNLSQYITESVQSKIVRFCGKGFDGQSVQEYMMNTMSKANGNHPKLWSAKFKSIDDLDVKDLLNQGVDYVVMYPPRILSNGQEIDNYNVEMFVDNKKVYDQFKSSEIYLVYDLKKQEFVNKGKIRGYKIKRLD